jgi:hypothetical protein
VVVMGLEAAEMTPETIEKKGKPLFNIKAIKQ